ncbi:MAG TPA: AraC family transcriptional regulator ligand-binding domain-containing protein [Aquabacterium sp.]|nr:AraC family transcriptional regulator ligand-binding domain-containing protein [Aquabacterium sp.]
MQTQEDWLLPAVHPVYARLICADLRRRGFTEAQALEGTRLNWQDLHGKNLFLSFEQLRRLIVHALALTACPWLGLNMGLGTHLSAHGAVGYAGMAADHVGQVLGLMQRFNNLRQRIAHFEVQQQDMLRLVLIERVSSPDVREYLMGNFAGGLIHLLETITGQDLRSQVVIHWPFAEPAWGKVYREFCPQSQFGSPQLMMDLPLAVLNLPSLAPDPEALRVALRDCERQLALEQGGDLAARIQRRLLGCEGDYPTLERMAEVENVSPRTLIRHLRQEGVTYQQLLDSVREELACWLLVQSSMSVEAIAEKLGYQDTSNFSRTFRRWLGITPSAFRLAKQDLQSLS